MKLSDLKAYSVKTVDSAFLNDSSKVIYLSRKVRTNRHSLYAKGAKLDHLKVKENKYYSNKILG